MNTGFIHTTGNTLVTTSTVVTTESNDSSESDTESTRTSTRDESSSQERTFTGTVCTQNTSTPAMGQDSLAATENSGFPDTINAMYPTIGSLIIILEVAILCAM